MKQRVWRNISKPSATGIGYFLTEVIEVIGEPIRWPNNVYIPTKDNGYIIITRLYAETEEQLKRQLAESFDDQLITTIQPRKAE